MKKYESRLNRMTVIMLNTFIKEYGVEAIVYAINHVDGNSKCVSTDSELLQDMMTIASSWVDHQHDLADNMDHEERELPF